MDKSEIQFVIRADVISMLLPGESTPCMVRKGHPKFAMIVEALKNDQVEQIQSLLHPIHAFCASQNGRLEIRDGVLFFDGEELHDVLSQKINEMISRDEDPSKFLRFMENLRENPEERAVNELYGFIENNALPITEDGYMLAYKTVRLDFYDHYSVSVLYAPGESPSMERELVCNDPEQTCASGLHVCTVGYLKNQFFGGDRRSRLVLVKVHPRDVVSVPIDYENSKLRCCAMTVIAEFGVHSGIELVEVDAGIRKSLDVLQRHLKLDEAELREIIGVQPPQDGLNNIGNFGQSVSFEHKDDIKTAHLIRAILPSQSLHTGMQYGRIDIGYRFSELTGAGGAFVLDDLEITNWEKIAEKRISSLDTRLLMLGITQVITDE
ncbi:MAG: hypothetical protein RSG77_17620, partial [Hafnia sp.]